MKSEYLRIDMLTIIGLSRFGLVSGGVHTYDDNLDWLKALPQVEYRHDYQCFFVEKGSPSHTAIAMKFGDIFD
jgi:hypothetical protein